MSLLDKVKKGVEKAREEASDLAQTTKIKMEVGKLQGRRTELLTEIGKQVYSISTQGRPVAEVDPQVQEIRKIDEEIARLQAEAERVKRED